MLPTSDHPLVMNGFTIVAARPNHFGYSKMVDPIHTEGRAEWCDFYNTVKCGRWLPIF